MVNLFLMPSEISEALPPKYIKYLGGITMQQMIVSELKITINFKNDLLEYTISLPEGTEILSVSSKRKDEKDILSVQLMYPVGSASTSLPQQEFSFTVVHGSYSKVTIDDHKYIGTITIDNHTFVVFYKKGKLIK